MVIKKQLLGERTIAHGQKRSTVRFLSQIYNRPAMNARNNPHVLLAPFIYNVSIGQTLVTGPRTLGLPATLLRSLGFATAISTYACPISTAPT